jgi:hypothetical protein
MLHATDRVVISGGLDQLNANNAPLPPRIDLKAERSESSILVAFKDAGREVPGGAAIALDTSKTLKSLTVRTLINDVVIGLMSATLEQ